MHIREHRVHFLDALYRQVEREAATPFAAMLPHDMELVMPGRWTEETPFAGSYEGFAEVRQMMRELFAAVDVQLLQKQYELVDDTHVSSHVRLVLEVAATGKTVDLEVVFVWKYASQNSIRPYYGRVYFDTGLWVKAFQAGGETSLIDTRDELDDHQVLPSEADPAEVVGSIYDSFYSGDIPAVLALMAPEPMVYFKGEDFPFAGIWQGTDGLLNFIWALGSTVSLIGVEIDYIAEGDRVDLVIYEHWTVLANQWDLQVDTVNSWRLDEQGRALGFTSYPDTFELLKAYQE